MKVAIFGLGYVGSTAAGCIASQGHEVVGIDVSSAKVSAVNEGRSPVAEPGLADLIAKARRDGLLSATTQIGSNLDDCDIAIVCVGTPSGVEGAHNMSYIVQVTRSIADAVKPDRAAPLTVAYRSTMRPGSTDHLILPIFRSRLAERTDDLVELVYNPEFLREASAIRDYFDPPKIVLGTRDGRRCARMEDLHNGIDAPIFHVGLREAEITKFVDNSWHAVKVAFANEIGRVCEQLDISARQVHEIFVSDTKLNISAYYTRPGGAFGGSCLPKDVRALQHIAADVGANTHLVDALMRTNEAHKHHQFLKATHGLEEGDRILLVGLAFKKDTDDLRESPAVDLARKMLAAGFDLDIFDPALKPADLVGQNLGYAFAALPAIETLLVSREEAETRDYARVVATNRLVDALELGDTPVLDASVIA
ncbi:nucleotide sugar dehydrogenase [Aurantiacibacter spongiae]|uniref:UDP-glucose 6-dehydrogenase n=1 Tax=Aurantiacibacter spongiae TaxID=2488860 RepID=A0A3N5CQY9_9SPHN|nr:nucleotide sugar dehydrogenase [Aurantiacibacter spongiae]RPF71513.1 nucleotide sugar dehydrogenase [Aurantiacibacter spongiae]